MLGTLQNCRTAALGGHIDYCTDCGILRNSYNSCRDRHCPKCQGLEKERWIEARKDELLHTWGQTMERHIHLHCIVPGGALTFDGQQFKPCPHRDWLFPVKALSKVFRGKDLERLERAHTTTDCSPADTARASSIVPKRCSA